ncbi:MAG: RIP metalloprotease RseP [Cryomorphaceae bacterium]|nr:MAG: RIP metalloprotease RseP [Cryomorphaceae bacterium]
MLVTIAQLLLSLSILVVLHELGHFIPAKLFKTRVEKFYLFFNPWFSLFKKKIGETTYGIGWLPLGGYVKISGMIDESMDKDQMTKPPEPWEFRAKPTWQRLIIMVGGVTVNLLLGAVLYMMVLFVWGKEYLPLQNMTYGVHFDSIMHEQGFIDGDKILKIGDRTPETLSEVSRRILIDGERDIAIDRGGNRKTITLDDSVVETILDRKIRSLFMERFPFQVAQFVPGSEAEKAGVQVGDFILGANDTLLPFFYDFARYVPNFGGDSIWLQIERNGMPMTIRTRVSEEGRIGAAPEDPRTHLHYERIDYSFGESIPAGWSHGIQTLSDYVKSLRLLFSPAGAKQVGGFGTIGSLFGEEWHWQRFWEMTAFISIMLAFMNILPIPALDGGHVMFLMYEMVTGRKPGEKFMEYAQIFGMVLLLTLVVFANLNDILNSQWFSNLSESFQHLFGGSPPGGVD